MNLIVVPVVAKKGYRPGKIIIKFLLHFLIYAKIIIMCILTSGLRSIVSIFFIPEPFFFK